MGAQEESKEARVGTQGEENAVVNKVHSVEGRSQRALKVTVKSLDFILSRKKLLPGLHMLQLMSRKGQPIAMLKRL